MGTRSLTFVYDEGHNPLVNMYCQFDGYPSGHGLGLAKFLNSFAKITNGISTNETRKTANGMGCLAAQMLAHFKNSVGGIYIEPVTAKECGQDYEYHVYKDRVSVKEHGDYIFTGPWTEFIKFCENAE